MSISKRRYSSDFEVVASFAIRQDSLTKGLPLSGSRSLYNYSGTLDYTNKIYDNYVTIATISLGVNRNVRGLIYSPVNSMIYGHDGSSRVYIINPSTNVVSTLTFATMFQITDFCYAPSTDKIYFSSYNSAYEFDPLLSTLTATISCSNGPMCYSPISDKVYVSPSSTGSPYLIDPTTKTSIVVGGVGDSRQIAYVPGKNSAYIPSPSSGFLAEFSFEKNNVINYVYSSGLSHCVYCPSNNLIYCSGSTIFTNKIVDPWSNSVVYSFAFITTEKTGYLPNVNRVSFDGALVDPITNILSGGVQLCSCYCPTNKSIYTGTENYIYQVIGT